MSNDNEQHPYEHLRVATIHLENTEIQSGMWSLEIAKTLREYAEAVENGDAGQNATAIFDSNGGTKMTIIAGTWIGRKSPELGTFVRPVLT